MHITVLRKIVSFPRNCSIVPSDSHALMPGWNLLLTSTLAAGMVQDMFAGEGEGGKEEKAGYC